MMNLKKERKCHGIEIAIILRRDTERQSDVLKFTIWHYHKCGSIRSQRIYFRVTTCNIATLTHHLMDWTACQTYIQIQLKE